MGFPLESMGFPLESIYFWVPAFQGNLHFGPKKPNKSEVFPAKVGLSRGDPERLLRLHCEDLLLMTRQVRVQFLRKKTGNFNGKNSSLGTKSMGVALMEVPSMGVPLKIIPFFLGI